ncbi:MAG: tRNA (guanosine(37)-N1)-methyltransferase TrmD [Polynucleobacter sp.]|nr:MAG: tRNA (guanosine(37)-N1)-methyltransferase TrmD [Polynucleobacter sp.]
MRFDVVTLFPEMFSALSAWGVTGRAFEQGLVSLKTWNPRDYTTDARRTVDDRAYGGGPGMVMMAKPLEDTLDAIAQDQGAKKGPVILLSPQGEQFNQQLAADIHKLDIVTFICGRYEAIDQRLVDRRVDREISLGDFVVSGGEIPAMAVMDAVIRLIPGALGDAESVAQDSFMTGLLDCYHYTRPENYENLLVPDVLLGGHHAKIADYRRKQSLELTLKRRPDLIEKAREQGLLSHADEAYLLSLQNKTGF